MKNSTKLFLLFIASSLILFGGLSGATMAANKKTKLTGRFITNFLDKLIQLPDTKSELKNLLNIPSVQEVNRIYHVYIEDYKIESFDETSKIYSVLVKPRMSVDEVDSYWTTRLNFKLSIVGKDTFLMPSVMNRIARSYWEKEEISENRNPRVDYSQKWIKANIHTSLQYVDVLDDISAQDMKTVWSREEYDGVFGKNYNRIRVKFVDLKKNDEKYEVSGFTILKEKKIQFKGTIKPIRVISHNDPGSDIPPVTVISEYQFQEIGSDNGSFSGIMVSSCYFKDGQLLKDDRGSVAAEYRNNTFVGVWTNAKKTANYKCIWGDGRLPYTTDFDIGSSEMYINEKYRNNGWNDK